MSNILVIGENCIDRFVYCRTEKLSPEAPVPVVIPIDTVVSKGMSGNVVRNIQSLDSKFKIVHWHQREEVTKTRFVDKKSNHIFIRVDEGDFSVKKINLDKKKLRDLVKYDIVIVSDYNKGFLSDDDLYKIAKKSKISILDSKRKLNNQICSSFDFVKLNEKEFENNIDIQDNQNIILTMGENGCKYQNVIFPCENPKQTIDVSGAGDTFTASFILKYFETKNIEDSIIFANKMASIVVSKKGVSTPN
jgi:bifunctional ADP-heptose synthase (sugar kinase/adenylyltransferase)